MSGTGPSATRICSARKSPRRCRSQPVPANILVNVTNLAWFGDTIALDQHLQIWRMRALEMRRPMLRSTNTGMTAVVTPDGVVAARAGLHGRHAHRQCAGHTGLTPYVRWGNIPALAACLLVLALAAWRRRQQR
ncbi:nitrilase-related carbon-nitrogen hydrolase [Cupriavidus basilensis]